MDCMQTVVSESTVSKYVFLVILKTYFFPTAVSTNHLETYIYSFPECFCPQRCVHTHTFLLLGFLRIQRLPNFIAFSFLDSTGLGFCYTWERMQWTFASIYKKKCSEFINHDSVTISRRCTSFCSYYETLCSVLKSNLY